MGQHGSKAAYIGGGLIAALAIIGIVFSIFQTSAGMNKISLAKLARMVGLLQETEYTQYDGAIVTGIQVDTIIRNHVSDEISIIVNNGNNTTSYIYTATVNFSDREAELGSPIRKQEMEKQLSGMETKKDKKRYLHPGKPFACTLFRDPENGAITALYFAPAN